MGARALGRRAGPPEDQVGHARLREDRRASALPLLRQRRASASTSSREELLEHYHAIVYATGSPSTGRWASPAKTCPARTPRPSSSAGTTATPTTRDLEFDLLSAERAVVIGNGNVALDVARMLVLGPPSWRRPTRPTTRSRCSRASSVARGRRRRAPRARAGGVHEPRAARARRAGRRRRDRRRRRARARARRRRSGRRGRHDRAAQRRDPARLRRQAPAGARQADRAALPALAGRAPRRRARAARARSAGRATSWSPTSDGALRAQAPPSERETLAAGLVVARDRLPRACPLPGVPFDERGGVIPNEGGRVHRARQRRAAAGRVRRRLDQARAHRRDRHEQEGRPGDRRRDARGPRAAATRLREPARPPEPPTRSAIEVLLRARQPELVTYEGWASDRPPRARARRARRPPAREADADRGDARGGRRGIAEQRPGPASAGSERAAKRRAVAVRRPVRDWSGAASSSGRAPGF